MAKRPLSDTSQDTPPQTFPETTPKASDMAHFTSQLIFEMHNTLGKVEVKLDNLSKAQDATTKKIDGLDERIGKIEHKASLLTGVLLCAVFLIPTCATIVWWSLGHQIEAALHMPSVPATAPGAAPAAQNTPTTGQ